LPASLVVAVIPVLNEAGAIGRTIAALPTDVVGVTIVVDGGSRDGTVEEARAAGAEVLIEPRPGYGRACALGAARAAELGAGVVLFLDGDGADPAELAGRLVAPVLADEADLVLATRTGQREPGSMGSHQVLAGRLVGFAIGLVCGVHYTDMSAFRAIGLDRLAALQMREMTYGWNLEMQMRAAQARLRVREVPLPYRRRIAGESKVAGTVRGTLKAGWRIIATFVRVWLDTRR
jgi:glycosyltransferase involved in cell wall biosynthesis